MTSRLAGHRDRLESDLKYCFWRVYFGVGQTLEFVLANRLHLGWRGSYAAQLRTDAELRAEI
jgi:hypothetical protein